jgi:hypothetical protein
MSLAAADADVLERLRIYRLNGVAEIEGPSIDARAGAEAAVHEPRAGI